jgi:hypothetical protein
MRRRLALALLLPALALGACGDDGDDVGSDGGTTEPRPVGGDPIATFEGTITQVTRFEPVTEGCTPPEDLDPDGSVSSDDPPVCTDPATAPLGSILVETDPDGEGGEKIVFTIRQETTLEQQYTGLGEDEREPIDFDQLDDGRRVEVGFDGQVAESFPGQATAGSVVVLDPGS